MNNENDPRSTQAWRKRLAALAVPDPKPSPRKPLPASPSTIAAIRRLTVEQRRAFMEASDFLRSSEDGGDLVAGLDHYERIVAKPVIDCLWRAAHEVDPLIDTGTRKAHAARTSGRRFDVLVRSAVTIDPPATTTGSSNSLLTQLEGRAVPYSSWAIVGAYEESHAYGSLDGSTGPGQPALPLMLNHGRDNPWPIGKSSSWQNQPDGLHGIWQLDDEPDAQRAARQARSGELGFLSIAFVPIRSEWDMHPAWDPLVGNLDRVTRVESRLTETSIVHAPAFPTATVSNVRNAHTQQRSQSASIVDQYGPSVVAWKIEARALHRRYARQAVTVAPAQLTTNSTIPEIVAYCEWLNSRIATLEGLGGNIIAPLTPSRAWLWCAITQPAAPATVAPATAPPAMTGPVTSTIRIQTFQTAADRDTAIPNPGPGELCYIIGSGAVRLTGTAGTGIVITIPDGANIITAVRFDNTPAEYRVTGDTTIEAVAPPHAAGEVTLTVTTDNGETKECGGRFAYV